MYKLIQMDQWMLQRLGIQILVRRILYIKHLSLQGKISFAYTSSRSYKIKGTDIKIGAIKAYPLSVFLNRSIIKKLIKEINLSISSFQTEENRIFSNNKDYIPDDMVYREK